MVEKLPSLKAAKTALDMEEGRRTREVNDPSSEAKNQMGDSHS